MNPFPRPLLLAAAFAALCLPGCSTVADFELFLEVINQADGEPLAGVSVSLDDLGNEEHKFDVQYGFTGKFTDMEGRVTQDFMVSPYPSSALRWYLKVSKEGFETQVIDIKPNPQPERPKGSGREAIPLKVRLKLKPIDDVIR